MKNNLASNQFSFLILVNTKLERTRLISKLGFTNLILYSDQLRYQQKKVRIRYDQEVPQTNPRHREEEPQNTNSHKTSGRQLK